MNPTRWAFLYHGIQRNELQEMEIQQATLAKALGLPLIPVRDQDGRIRAPKNFSEMSGILPAVARPGFMEALMKVWQEREVDAELGDIPELDVDIGAGYGDEDEDTPLEILGRPTDFSKMSEADRQQLLQISGVLSKEEADANLAKELGEEKPRAPRGATRPEPKGGPPTRSSFVLDD